MVDTRPVLRELVGLMNRYRLALETENELWISRHHGFTAHDALLGLAPPGKLPIDGLWLSIPIKTRLGDMKQHPVSSQPKLYLHWAGSQQFRQSALRHMAATRQSWDFLTVDRNQETRLARLFMAQAPVPAVEIEVMVYDHRRRRRTVKQIRPDERQLEGPAVTLAAPLDLNDWFEGEIQAFITITPTSTSPQPVHVLNGFFHHSLTGRRAPRTAIDFVATKAGEWAVGNAKLRQKSPY